MIDIHHIVWQTKGGLELLDGAFRFAMQEIISNLSDNIIWFEVMPNHVQVLVQGVEDVKEFTLDLMDRSAKALFQRYPNLSIVMGEDELWAEGFYDTRVEETSIENVIRYLESRLGDAIPKSVKP